MRKTVSYDNMSVSSEPLFAKCCFCIPLRIGCFILGYLNLVLNTFQTLALFTLTTYLGVTTHGFDHFDRPHEIDENTTVVESEETPFLNQMGVLLLVVLFVNVTWLVINVACLVGLHKERPGPIRVYVAFASMRLLLALASFVYLLMTSCVSNQAIITYSTDLGITCYFILVYYIYAMQLEREQNINQPQLETVTNDITIIYPTKTDKERLVF